MTPTKRQSLSLMLGILESNMISQHNQPHSIPTFTKARKRVYTTSEKYAPCQCGSGEKFKFCCMNKRIPPVQDDVNTSKS